MHPKRVSNEKLQTGWRAATQLGTRQHRAAPGLRTPAVTGTWAQAHTSTHTLNNEPSKMDCPETVKFKSTVNICSEL